MKVTINWLKQYVDFDWSPEELAERLTMLGVEVEGIEKIGGDFEGVVVAQVLTRDKHPNADKLSVCRVFDGKTERQIVCGAQNFKAGDKVPLVLPGATLPGRPGEGPLTIKVGKIRGVESHGMMCSPDELGLKDSVDGLLILPEDATVGQPFADFLGKAGRDVVYDLEITPNRPDLNSLIGIARELSAITRNSLKLPAVAPEPAPVASGSVADLVQVRIEDPEACPRYTARLLRGVRIGPSPDWLRSMLEKTGIRSINNVVDVTNYVMLETGQPLHAFDYTLLSQGPGETRPTIVVRRAAEGEVFTTLDGQERRLTSRMLLIADETKPVALAGVMGGSNSEIHQSTTDVLLESACFEPRSIRATSKKLELRSESSYRFERGADVGVCDWASRRAALLILQTAGGNLAPGVVDAYSTPAEPKQISLRPARANALLGLNLSGAEMVDFLSGLGLKQASRKPQPVSEAGEADSFTFRVPSFRVDLKQEVDLIEEVARLYGVDRIPSTPPRGAIGANEFDAVYDQIFEARKIFTSLGLTEAQGQTLISSTSARLVVGDRFVPLANPLSADMDALRPSLLPGLLDTLRHNLSRNQNDVALFELGRVFHIPASGTGVPREERRVAVALTGLRNRLFWSGSERDAKFDLFDLKGILEEFLEQFGVKGFAFQRLEAAPGSSLFLEAAEVQLGRLQLGQLGVLLPNLGRKYDLRDAVLLAELSLDQLLSRRNASKSFKPLPAYPSIRRDVAMLVPESVTHDMVLGVVKQTRAANLEAVELFDVFRGKNIPEGQKSMAYAFTYRSSERTLVDAEVSAEHERLRQQFKDKLMASLRE